MSGCGPRSRICKAFPSNLLNTGMLHECPSLLLFLPFPLTFQASGGTNLWLIKSLSVRFRLPRESGSLTWLIRALIFRCQVFFTVIMIPWGSFGGSYPVFPVNCSTSGVISTAHHYI